MLGQFEGLPAAPEESAQETAVTQFLQSRRSLRVGMMEAQANSGTGKSVASEVSDEEEVSLVFCL